MFDDIDKETVYIAYKKLEKKILIEQDNKSCFII